MKTKIITTIIAIFMLTINLWAQPLPPSTPFGSPVPVGAFGFLLLAFGAAFFVNRNKNQQNIKK